MKKLNVLLLIFTILGLYANVYAQNCARKPCQGREICTCRTYFPVAKHCRCIPTIGVKNEDLIYADNHSGSSQIILTAQTSLPFTVKIIDVNGRLIDEFDNLQVADNKDALIIDSNQLNDGVYLVKLETAEEIAMQKLFVAK